MARFMTEDYLLEGEVARWLYHEVGGGLPIIDYHCHIPPQEICEDRHFANLTEAWLGGDHYKWRLMRAHGIDERFITGDASPREKFDAYVSVMPLAIGNPLYAWSHMELRRYLDCELEITPANADAIWARANEILPTRGVRELIRMSRVEAIVTTDDPIDALDYHARLEADPDWEVTVLPGIRPDRALAFERGDYRDYLGQLAEAAGMDPIADLDGLKAALADRVDFFAARGCVSADHGLHHIPMPDPEADVEALFARVLAGERLDEGEQDALLAHMLVFLGARYHAHGWVMQFHVNALRGINSRMTARLGPDTGFDVMHELPLATPLARLLDAMDQDDALPRTILYSLNPNDDLILAAIAGSFPGGPGHVRHGAAWWFNDTKSGMLKQLETYANVSLLGHFAGMLTDSRSFLSYTRHEYFRRLFASFIGGFVERGEYPENREQLEQLMRRVCYENSRDMILGAPEA